MTLMRTSPVNFDLSSTKLIQLKKNGVSETLIQAMIQQQAVASGALALREEDLFNADDEAFFQICAALEWPETKRKDNKRSENSEKSKPIFFGSRSGSQSQSRRAAAGRRSRNGQQRSHRLRDRSHYQTADRKQANQSLNARAAPQQSKALSKWSKPVFRRHDSAQDRTHASRIRPLRQSRRRIKEKSRQRKSYQSDASGDG
ncbi:MAG: hypothetical protein U0Y68_04425 [Blastocatellia bacterium]